MSRTVIDVNRDPSGASLYPGQATTELCPTTTFDGEPLYRERPCAERQRDRRAPRLHTSIPIMRHRSRDRAAAIAAPRRIVLFEAHSIRSRIPRLFDGELPNFNIGTNGGATCDAGSDRSRRSGVRCQRILPRHRRPLQRRLDDAPLRPARRRRPRHPAGTGLPRLYGRAGRSRRPTTGRRATMATRAAAMRAVLHAYPRSLPSISRARHDPPRQHPPHPQPARTGAQLQIAG